MTAEEISQRLEGHGFKRSVCGDSVFEQAVKVVNLMIERHLGVIVSGPVGVGKTRFCRAVSAFFTVAQRIDMKQPVSQAWFTEPYYTRKLMNRSVFLDDVGVERFVNDYGVKYEPFGEFIMQYHAAWEGNDIYRPRLIISSNLYGGAFLERYTQRVTDRVLQMCVGWKMEGASKRGSVTVK